MEPSGAMKEHRLDAIVYPTLRVKPARIGDPEPGISCMVIAHSGLPAFSLPARRGRRKRNPGTLSTERPVAI
ncbi:MAG: hypothetical protein ACRD1Z_20780, partial [Vicinamibacteria bacterium]